MIKLFPTQITVFIFILYDVSYYNIQCVILYDVSYYNIQCVILQDSVVKWYTFSFFWKYVNHTEIFSITIDIILFTFQFLSDSILFHHFSLTEGAIEPKKFSCVLIHSPTPQKPVPNHSTILSWIKNFCKTVYASNKKPCHPRSAHTPKNIEQMNISLGASTLWRSAKCKKMWLSHAANAENSVDINAVRLWNNFCMPQHVAECRATWKFDRQNAGHIKGLLRW